MDQQAMTLDQIREKGLAILRQHLGIVGMVRFLQQSEMGGAIIQKSGTNGLVIQISRSWRKRFKRTTKIVET